jgi:hypothetical protein
METTGVLIAPQLYLYQGKYTYIQNFLLLILYLLCLSWRFLHGQNWHILCISFHINLSGTGLLPEQLIPTQQTVMTQNLQTSTSLARKEKLPLDKKHYHFWQALINSLPDYQMICLPL